MKIAYKPVIRFVATAAATFFAVNSIQALVMVLAYTKPARSHVLTPVIPRVTAYSSEKTTLDVSNVSGGCIMIKYTGSVGKIKVQITKSGSEIYTHDLSSSDVYEVFPLSEDSGSYSMKVFENIQGSQYPQAFNQNVNASITDQFGPFPYPNQCVNFDAVNVAVQTGTPVTANATDQLDVASDVYNHVINNATYDTAKASSAQSGYLFNADMVLAQKKDIRFDYAALMIAMPRSQNIPTELTAGCTGSLYHVWINVYPEGQGWVDNIIYFDDNSWKPMDSTLVPSSGQSQEVMQYIGNDSNYGVKYSY